MGDRQEIKTFFTLSSNEFRAYTETPCASLVPTNAPSVANQVCAIAGAVPGSATVNANTYLAGELYRCRDCSACAFHLGWCKQ